MLVGMCTFTLGGGWYPHVVDSKLDCSRTLTVAFGAPEYIEHPLVCRELRARGPTSHVIGWEAAGEILNVTTSDHSVFVAVVPVEHVGLRSAATSVDSPEAYLLAGTRIADELYNHTMTATTFGEV